MDFQSTNQNQITVKLIFNPSAGIAEESPVQFLDVISEMQSHNFVPEPYLVGPDCDLKPVVQDALARGIRMFVVCGGDGTIECLAGTLVGADAILGIIPTGTRNNVALSLGIPREIPAAVELLHKGEHVKVDVGLATCGVQSRVFLETCSIGLFSALFPAADEIQHGNLTRIGDFLAALISSPSAEMRLIMDKEQEIMIRGHVALVANFPYVGPNFRICSEGSFHDGLLEILVFPDLSKLDLLSNVAQMGGNCLNDPRIQRYQAQRVELSTDPSMPVMVDGFSLGEGALSVETRHGALEVIADKEVTRESLAEKAGDFSEYIDRLQLDSGVIIEVRRDD